MAFLTEKNFCWEMILFSFPRFFSGLCCFRLRRSEYLDLTFLYWVTHNHPSAPIGVLRMPEGSPTQVGVLRPYPGLRYVVPTGQESSIIIPPSAKANTYSLLTLQLQNFRTSSCFTLFPLRISPL
jgi:hypothetical protein